MALQKELAPLSKIEQSFYDKLLTSGINIDIKLCNKTFSPKFVIETELYLVEADGVTQIPEYRKAEIFGRFIMDMCAKKQEQKIRKEKV
jgi:hypothetical protein